MAEAPNQTRIANAVLLRLGSTERLTSIDDPTSNSAKRIKAVWDDVRRVLLARHPWNHAIARKMLNEHADRPVFGWERQYRLPGDCIRWLPPARGSREYYDGEREGDFILTNAAAPLPCRYIFDNDSVPSWSPMFISAITYCLAEWLAEGITQSSGITDRMVEIADRAIKAAKRIDGLETGQSRRQGVVAQSTWLNARNRGWHGVRG